MSHDFLHLAEFHVNKTAYPWWLLECFQLSQGEWAGKVTFYISSMLGQCISLVQHKLTQLRGASLIYHGLWSARAVECSALPPSQSRELCGVTVPSTGCILLVRCIPCGVINLSPWLLSSSWASTKTATPGPKNDDIPHGGQLLFKETWQTSGFSVSHRHLISSACNSLCLLSSLHSWCCWKQKWEQPIYLS